MKKLPNYVICDFPHHKGPIFNDKNKTFVPIPCHIHHCKKGCRCQHLHIPLFSVYAKTIHSCQGVNVGPTDDDKPDNEIQSIVACPGTHCFESTSPGLIHTVIGRVTTLEDPSDFTMSSLHYVGPNMNEHRIRWITRKNSDEVYKKVALRTLWQKFLDHQEQQTLQPPSQLHTLHHWWQNANISSRKLHQIIEFWS